MIEPVYEDIPTDLITTETDDQRWLREQIARRDPFESEQGNDGARTKALEKLVIEMREEIAIDNKLIEARNRVLAAIPGCPDHGDQCIPHALEWIEAAKAAMAAKP